MVQQRISRRYPDDLLSKLKESMANVVIEIPIYVSLD